MKANPAIERHSLVEAHSLARPGGFVGAIAKIAGSPSNQLAVAKGVFLLDPDRERAGARSLAK